MATERPDERDINQNPDEDSWTCVQRLASQVNWLAFPNGDCLSAQEVELRRQTRTGLRVERAVNPPGGRPAPATAPRVGADEE